MKINNITELRGALQEKGYASFYIEDDRRDGVERGDMEIDYIPKTDKFLVENQIGHLIKFTTSELEGCMIGSAMREGKFFKKD